MCVTEDIAAGDNDAVYGHDFLFACDHHIIADREMSCLARDLICPLLLDRAVRESCDHSHKRFARGKTAKDGDHGKQVQPCPGLGIPEDKHSGNNAEIYDGPYDLYFLFIVQVAWSTFLYFFHFANNSSVLSMRLWGAILAPRRAACIPAP